MKCPRCGKVYDDDLIEVCEECGYNFAEGKRVSQVLDSKSDPDVDETKESDLYDYPILCFVLSLLGLLIPVFILKSVRNLASCKSQYSLLDSNQSIRPYRLIK